MTNNQTVNEELINIGEPPQAQIPYGDANYNGWVCGWCGCREYPTEKGLTTCAFCERIYSVPYVR